ncbi:MAG: DNA polymerase III subunit delta [Candidatus Cloacimonetes bacterium]|nr:DNA polymerase III subunit delta [Candidatus Cloacimonadota bacterium]
MKKQKTSFASYEFFGQFSYLKTNTNYLIFGNENYLKDRVLSQILAEFTDENSSDFDKTILYGDSTSPSIILENLEMLPFLAKKRITVLKDLDYFKANELNRIKTYFQNPLSSSVFIILADKIDARTSFYKDFCKIGITINCKPPYSSTDIMRWLRSELQKNKKRMDNEAMQFFSNSIELDFLIAANEFEKLILISRDSNFISLSDVKQSVGFSRKNKIFDLQNTIGSKRKKESLEILQNLIENEDASKIGVILVTILTRFFTKLWMINALRVRNNSDREIVDQHLRDVFYKYRNSYLGFANNYNLKKLPKVFDLLLQADIDLKSLNLKAEILLEILIFKILKIGNEKL